MPRNLVRFLVCAILVVGATRALAVPTGAPATRTGALGILNKPAEPNCTVCHYDDASGLPGGINQPGGGVELLGVPDAYVPGAIYPLTVRLHHDWNPVPPDPLRWGFQLQAVQASTGDSAGIWLLTPNVSPDSFKIVKASPTSVYKNRRYLDQAGWILGDEHPGGPTHYGEVGPVEWHMNWQAPPGDSGKIYFFAAGNSTNGDDLCFASGDWVFTTMDSTVAGVSVGVPLADGAGITALEAPTPNPAGGATSVSFTLAKGGVTELSVFDLSGRRVRTLKHEFLDAGRHTATWSGRDDRGQWCPNGVYFIRLFSPEPRTSTRKLVLSR